jgi:type VI protein secretion system component VasF
VNRLFFRKPPPDNPRVRRAFGKHWFDHRTRKQATVPAKGIADAKAALFLFWWIFISLLLSSRKKIVS